MWFNYSVLLAVAIVVYQILQITSHVEFTNLKCISLDKNFSDFEQCRIKAVNRTYKYVTFKINLFQVPVTNISVNVSVMKRLNGYKPFLYNVTFDACKFQASKGKNPVVKYFYSFIKDHSNLNHTCPFNEDLVVDQVSIDFLNHQLAEVLPFPKGDYAAFTSWYAYSIIRADVKVYLTIS